MKKIFLIIIGFFIILSTIFLLFITYNKHSKQIPVLVYHNIVPTDVEKDSYDTLKIDEFEAQIKYLKDNGYTSISPEDFFSWKNGHSALPDKSVLITFDDGYYSFKYLVQPILEKYDFNALCFLIGDSTPEITPEYNAHVYGTIGKDEINNHIKNVYYGSHTYSMHVLTENNEKLINTLNKEDLKKDTELFKDNIFNAEYLAYPYYTYNNKYIDVLKELNYKLAFAGEEEMATRKVNNFKIPRISGVKSFYEFKEIFETDKYKNKYGNGLIRKICVNIERRILKK